MGRAQGLQRPEASSLFCGLIIALEAIRLIACHPEPQARDLLCSSSSPTSTAFLPSSRRKPGSRLEALLLFLGFRSLPRASHLSLLAHCAACGANGEAGPEGERRRRESRKGDPKKAFPAHAHGAWALSRPRASGAQAGVFAPVGRARQIKSRAGSRTSRHGNAHRCRKKCREMRHHNSPNPSAVPSSPTCSRRRVFVAPWVSMCSPLVNTTRSPGPSRPASTSLRMLPRAACRGVSPRLS